MNSHLIIYIFVAEVVPAGSDIWEVQYFFYVSTFEIMWQRKRGPIPRSMRTGSCLLERDYEWSIWLVETLMTETLIYLDARWYFIPWYGLGFDKLSFYWIDRKRRKKRPDWFIDFSFFFRPRDKTRFEIEKSNSESVCLYRFLKNET